MGKLAFIFPGQGAQKAGMGKDLADAFPEARAVFDQVDAALGEKLSTLCFEGPDGQLKLTANTKPAILTVSVAAAAVLAKAGIAPDFVAGHSLGEYSALVAAGAISAADAARSIPSGHETRRAAPRFSASPRRTKSMRTLRMTRATRLKK